MKIKVSFLLLAFLFLSFCSKQEKVAPIKEGQPITIPSNVKTTSSGLKYIDLVEGKGETPQTGQKVIVQYTGWLMNGKKFDSSIDRKKPIEFALGQGEVIPGMDEGISTMKVGGKRRLFIPYQLAYGERGYPPVIPPKAMLVFDVELLDIE